MLRSCSQARRGLAQRRPRAVAVAPPALAVSAAAAQLPLARCRPLSVHVAPAWTQAAGAGGAGGGVPFAPRHALFRKVMAANRGEIAIRVLRAATELDVPSVSIFSFEDRFSPHRYKADESFLVGRGLSPVAAYLSIKEIVRVGREAGVQVRAGGGDAPGPPDWPSA
jgi:hypothetical protein